MAIKKTSTSSRKRKPAARAKKIDAAAAPTPVAETPEVPKRRRGRPPGSTSGTLKGKRITKAAASRASQIAKQPVDSLRVSFNFDEVRAANLENLERQEAEVKEVLKAIQKAKTAFGKLNFAELLLNDSPIATGRRSKKRGPKRGYKRGGLTKREQIIKYVTDNGGGPIKSGEIVRALFEASGESDKKSFTQSMFTTLSQIYKSGELKKDDAGNVSLNS